MSIETFFLGGLPFVDDFQGVEIYAPNNTSALSSPLYLVVPRTSNIEGPAVIMVNRG